MKLQHPERTLENMTLNELKVYCDTFEEVPREVLQATLSAALVELQDLEDQIVEGFFVRID